MVNSNAIGNDENGERTGTFRGRPRRSFPDWSGGALCLDFSETLEHQSSKFEKELLNSYQDLVAWGEQMGILDSRQAGRLANEAVARPEEAAGVLDRALALRKVIYNIFSAVAGGRQPAEEDLSAFNSVIGEALDNLRIIPDADGFTYGWAERQDALDSVLWPVVWSALDLLTSDRLALVRNCDSPDCSSLFLDTSKNHSRRWCDMKSCGNRAKVARYYNRRKHTTG